MKKTIASICAAAVLLSAAGAALPANAAPPMQQHHRHATFQKHGNYAYLNGHRGDIHFHKGWRQYNGYWFPPAAFIGFAILGGILESIH